MGDSSAGEPTTLITPYQDGPLIIRGDFRIQTWDGMPIPAERQTVALCRCGRSAIKPFCDGSHTRVGFRAPAGARADTTRTARPRQDRPEISTATRRHDGESVNAEHSQRSP